MDSFTIGIIAGTLTTISFIPQIIKIYKTKNAKDLSILMFLIFSLGVLLWLIYGITIGERPIIIANCVTLFFILLILAMKVRYR
ncbi:MAG: SemiSWEET transporter [Candidatus Omnitrophota bacterium]|nr:SemiSWEET transporter [Candidatus Omnitrophota bacterium]